MFTVEQIKSAHSKVRSGGDFPSYIHDIKNLGVTFYEVFVSDGHADYYGENNYRASSLAKHDSLNVASTTNIEQFRVNLKAHQQGKTNYQTFLEMCAMFGVEKWAVSMEKMTCIYYDKAGNEVLAEQIPR